MHTRQTPRTIPEKPNYWSLELGDKGTHNFRDPLPVYRALIGKALNDADFAALAIASKDGVLAGGMAGVWPIVGAVLGLCWFDASRDLDTPPLRTFGGDVLAYGEDVLYEMQDEGYADKDIGPVLAAFLKRALNVQELVKEAKDRADFSEAATEPSS